MNGNNSKTMKNFVRLLALILACLFCVMTAVACNEEPVDTGDDETPKTEGTIKDGVLYMPDEWGALREYDALPDDLDYDDETIRVLYWSDVEKPEFEQQEEVDDARMSAIYNRNLAIQQRLGVNLRFSSVKGNSSNVNGFVSHVSAAKTAGTHDFDIIGTYSRTAGALAKDNLLVDVMAIQKTYLELERPWWPSGIVDHLKIGNSLYFLSGDMSITAIDEMHCVYFNKDLINIEFEAMAEEAGVEPTDSVGAGTAYMYQLVRNGQWTLDKFIEMCNRYYVDLDGDGQKSFNDQYGLTSINYCACTLYNAVNLRMIEPDATKTLKISDNFTSMRTVKMVKNLYTLYGSDNYRGAATGGGYILPFAQGRGLFALQYIELAENNLVGNEAVAHYGLVPLPKYDQYQKNYYSVIGNAFTIYCIFSDFDRRDGEQETLTMLSAVLECWASEAFRKTTPVVFELNMQLKYSETQDETDMCEYVRAGIRFDLGRIFDSILGYSLDAQVYNAAESGESWVSYYAPLMSSIETALETFIDGMKTNVAG